MYFSAKVPSTVPVLPFRNRLPSISVGFETTPIFKKIQVEVEGSRDDLLVLHQTSPQIIEKNEHRRHKPFVLEPTICNPADDDDDFDERSTVSFAAQDDGPSSKAEEDDTKGRDDLQ